MATNVYACPECLTVARENVWDFKGVVWVDFDAQPPADNTANLEALAAREALTLTAPPGPPHWKEDAADKPLWQVARDAFRSTIRAAVQLPAPVMEQAAWEAVANAVAEAVVARLRRGA